MNHSFKYKQCALWATPIKHHEKLVYFATVGPPHTVLRNAWNEWMSEWKINSSDGALVPHEL